MGIINHFPTVIGSSWVVNRIDVIWKVVGYREHVTQQPSQGHRDQRLSEINNANN